MSNSNTNTADIPQPERSNLEKLGAEGKFISVFHNIPSDVLAFKGKVSLEGKVYPTVTEVYAPGDDTGYAVLMIYDEENHNYVYEVVRGNWVIEP